MHDKSLFIIHVNVQHLCRFEKFWGLNQVIHKRIVDFDNNM